jgi:hypothetical protein
LKLFADTGSRAADIVIDTTSLGLKTIPFSAFNFYEEDPESFPWDSITFLNLETVSYSTNAGSTSWAVGEVVVVPEPSQMMFVAGAGMVLGAWQLRRLRRGCPVAGESLAG